MSPATAMWRGFPHLGCWEQTTGIVVRCDRATKFTSISLAFAEEERNLYMSMVDPKGGGPKIRGKSKVFELIARDRKLRQKLERKVWPALPPELVEIDSAAFEIAETS